MTAAWVRALRPCTAAVLAVLLLQWPALAATDEVADFHAAVVQASSQYRLAMTTLNTRGREETSVAPQAPPTATRMPACSCRSTRASSARSS